MKSRNNVEDGDNSKLFVTAHEAFLYQSVLSFQFVLQNTHTHTLAKSNLFGSRGTIS